MLVEIFMPSLEVIEKVEAEPVVVATEGVELLTLH